jgi:hypothetical protein
VFGLNADADDPPRLYRRKMGFLELVRPAE